MKKLILCMLTLLLLSNVSGADNSIKTIKLGVVAPLTGDFANHGRFIQEGVEQALKEYKGQEIDIKIYYEDACLPAKAVTAVKKLIAQGIDAIVGSYCVIGMVPMAPFLERNKILAFHTSAVPDAILDAGEYIFTTNVTIRNEANALAELAVNDLGAKKAGIFYFPSDWGEDYSKYFAKGFAALGGQVVANDLTQLSQMDFRAELLRMKARKVDVIFAAHISSALGTMVKQARELGMDVQFLSTDEAEDPQFFEVAREYADGMQILVPESNHLDTTPHVLTANAYDATKLAVSAIKACNFQKECIKDYAYNVVNYQGVSGTFSINKDGGTTKSFVKKVAKGGAFVKVTEETPLLTASNKFSNEGRSQQ